MIYTTELKKYALRYQFQFTLDKGCLITLNFAITTHLKILV